MFRKFFLFVVEVFSSIYFLLKLKQSPLSKPALIFLHLSFFIKNFSISVALACALKKL